MLVSFLTHFLSFFFFPKVEYGERFWFSDPSDRLQAVLRRALVGPSFRFGVAESRDFSVDPDTLSREVQRARESLEMMCAGSAVCNHNYWWVAGGAASFVRGKTSSFGDVDFFVACRGKLKSARLPFAAKTNGGVVTLLRGEGGLSTIQIIPVGFTVGLDISITSSNTRVRSIHDLFGIFLLAHFDLPICRVAITHADTRVGSAWRCLDLSAISVTARGWATREICVHRRAKYESRAIPHARAVPCLAASVLYYLMLADDVTPRRVARRGAAQPSASE